MPPIVEALQAVCTSSTLKQKKLAFSFLVFLSFFIFQIIFQILCNKFLANPPEWVCAMVLKAKQTNKQVNLVVTTGLLSHYATIRRFAEKRGTRFKSVRHFYVHFVDATTADDEELRLSPV